MSALNIVILGGYGTFGGRLARLLADDERVSIVVSGRSQEAAEAFCTKCRGRAHMQGMAIDRSGPILHVLTHLAPNLVVDASGPFQRYGDSPYRVVEACLALGISYLDLADSSHFVEGIVQFDELARTKGVFVLSGASTLPALSTAVVRELARGWTEVHSITAGIAPSPQVELGRNVIGAVASYAGKKVQLMLKGRPSIGSGLIEARRYTIGVSGQVPLKSRRFTLVDVPDLRLAPKLWPKLQSIWIGVSTLPEATHRALTGLAWLVRLGAMRSLSSLAPLLHWFADHLRWGEDRGGMFVEVTGLDGMSSPADRSWHLVADGDNGPFVPVMAAVALVEKVLTGVPPKSGARAAMDDLRLADFASEFARRQISTATRTTLSTEQSLYRRHLSDAWTSLPEPIRTLHDGAELARGFAEVERGTAPLARVVAGIMRFPRAGTDVPVQVEFDKRKGLEVWRRTFAANSFSSVQFEGRGRSAGLLCERFGPLRFAMAMVIENDKLRLVVRRWSAFGIPLPMFAGPIGESYESAEDGRFSFHVEIGFSWTGLIVRYRGWLVPVT